MDASQGVALHSGIVGDGLRPAGDCGERGAQLMRDLRDKLRAGLFRDGDLFGHVVYLLGQNAEFIVTFLFELYPVGALGDAAGVVAELCDRL